MRPEPDRLQSPLNALPWLEIVSYYNLCLPVFDQVCMSTHAVFHGQVIVENEACGQCL